MSDAPRKDRKTESDKTPQKEYVGFGGEQETLETKITDPKPEDRDTLIELLKRSYFIRSKTTHEPLPCISNFHVNGVVSPVFSDKEEANNFAVQVEQAYHEETEVTRVTGLWDFFRDCASCGYEGAILDMYYPVTFYNRLTDMDRRLPSLMWMRFPDSVNDLYGFFFGRMGVAEMAPGSTVKWLDYERLDKASVNHALDGAPLPEGINAHTILDSHGNNVIFPNGATFLGPYVSDIGAVPVFSDRQWVIYFAAQHGLIDKYTSEDAELRDGYQIVQTSLFELLDKVREANGPFLDIGLNPLCHRFRQGWFFKHDDDWMLETISGVWDISSGTARLTADVQGYKGYLGKDARDETVEVSSVVDNPFKRLLGADRSPLSEDDANILLDQELGETFEPEGGEDLVVPPKDAFVLDAFDKIDGNKIAWCIFGNIEQSMGFLVFPDILAAARYLIYEVLPHDEETRLHGYGSPGSKDTDHESRITMEIRAAIRKTLFDALTKGYRPEHARHLQRLMQDATVTFEVTEIGYFGDLVFYGLADGNEIVNRLGADEPGNRKQKAKLLALRKKIADGIDTSPEVTARLRRSLADSFELAERDSIVIAASMLEELEKTGNRPGYDYSGISMKASKLIEREMKGRVFVSWREAARKQLGKRKLAELREQIEAERCDRTALALIDWLQKRSKIDLGSMRYCLKEIRAEDDLSVLLANLADHISGFNGTAWLLSDEFDDALADISTKYRNGGVHEHLVSYAVCTEAVERVVLGEQPVLRRLLESTTRAE